MTKQPISCVTYLDQVAPNHSKLSQMVNSATENIGGDSLADS